MTAALLILLVFLVFAALMYMRWMPALLAVPAMAILMALAVQVPIAEVGTIVVTGAVALAPSYVTVIFGALLARVSLDTGIARSIVNFAAEFGGEQPLVVALSLSVVVALLFVTFSGLGAIIMVGTIVLPIMMTIGVPRKVAATMFLMAFALGFIFNPAIFLAFYTKLFGVARGQLYAYSVVLAVIDLIALLVYAFVAFRKSRGYATWAVRVPRDPQERRVPWYALVTPVLPIVLTYVPAIHLDPILSFALSAIYGAIAARPKKAIETLTAAAIRGLEDVAPAVILFIGIGMLATAAKEPQFSAALHFLATSGIFRNPFFYVIIFGVLSPLALYRGPLNPFGIGIAIFVLLASANALPPVILVAAIMAVVQVQNVCDPTNTANVWIANFTGVQVIDITKRTLPYQVAVAIIACIVVVTASPKLFHVQPFTALVERAEAQTLSPPGMFAGASAGNRIAVGSDGTPDARAAAPAIVDALRAPDLQVFAQQEDPNAADCSAKHYSAYVNATSTRFTLIQGTDVDIGVQLFDCGGWEVTEWHDHAVFPQPTTEDAAQLARQGVDRLLSWARDNPQRWQHLRTDGLAYAAGDPPTYYYALYKTADGYMRAYVRAGGPAYAAGMRTNDIVDKLDGLEWWMYGTYQTQARAYDGKPHSFDLERNGAPVSVQLGAPFTT